MTLGKKTVMVIFRSKQNIFGGDLKIQLCSKRLHPIVGVKYRVTSWKFSMQQIDIGSIQIMGWCPAGPVLPHGGKVPL